ncbi:hypothetical protein EDC04DRAFT_2068919 [Pisolithus marmoratus]|nr:hypothetical protein EDC04DRAFT_2068919 [Pisolithus marmoratus]
MRPSLLTTPSEILEYVVLLAVRDFPHGPPSVLRSLRLSCRTLNEALSMEQNPHLYLMLFLHSFDMSSPNRHLPSPRLSAPALEQELRTRHIALKCIRRRDFDHPDLAAILATVYIMFLEDDGRNYEQLVGADLLGFLQQFLHDRILQDTMSKNAWPLENGVNTLAVGLFWFITSHCGLRQETQLRQRVIDILSYYAYAGFRYPCFTEPENMFYLSDKAELAVSNYGVYPPPRPVTMTVQYFGDQTKFTLPPVAPFAILNQFARAEKFPFKVPSELPANRQEALTMGILFGPTKEDIEHFNTHCNTRLICSRSDGFPKSQIHDADWSRSLTGVPSTSPSYYIPDTLTGYWRGSFMTPFIDIYKSMLLSDEAPSTFPFFGRFPLYVHFREYYCYSPMTPVPVEEGGNAFFDAFLPQGCQWYEIEDGIEIVGKKNTFRTKYVPFRGQQNSLRCSDVQDLSSREIRDVIIVGETEEPYASAWNGYKYIGRVRPSDGLVILLREPHDLHTDQLGRALFRGYVTSSCNFVGRWRSISVGEQPAEWESIFSMSKAVPNP